MELRRVDPRILKINPGNPRKIQPGEMSDAALAASIQAVGILQPPVVAEKNGELTIIYGQRRVRIAIRIGLPEIDVLVKDPHDHDNMRAVAENVARAPIATVDLWRSIESLASENWTEEAIAAALAIPVRQVRKLRLLAKVHPAILDAIGAGDMPREHELRTIASASREDQAAVWKKFKPKKGSLALWWQISQALQKTRFFARDAKFGEAEREAFGIVWQEDLFAEGDQDNRFTIDGEAYVAAQRAWVDANMPKNGVLLDVDEYGREKLPSKAKPIWTKPTKADKIGFAIDPRNGNIRDVVFRPSEPDIKGGKGRSINAGNDAPAPKRTRPEITQKGAELIGALRTEALIKSFEVNDCDDATLIGLLVLALGARNILVQSDRPTHSTRTKLVQSITEGGQLTHDAERIRIVARQMLAEFLSCSPGRNDSGLVARIAGDALGADAHISTMATEEFLACLSKAGIEKVGTSLRVLPRPRAKDTRAEVIKQASGTTYVHPAAHFALTEAEIAHHAEAPRDYSWSERDPGEDDDDGAGDVESRDSIGAEHHDDVVAEHERNDDDTADGDARVDDEIANDAPLVTPTRSRSARRRPAAPA
jgi:ParB family chromosome partitioning protein